MPLTAPRELVVPVTVEFEDVDAYRIAHHTRLVAYLERARVRFFGELAAGLDGQAVAPVLYDLRVRFIRPARLLDRLEVAVSVRELGEYRLVLAYRVRRAGGEPVLRATTDLVFTNLDAGGIEPVPAAYVAAMRPYLPPDAAGDGATEPAGSGEGTR